VTDIALNGLDGSNPLAYLAALGALRMTSLAFPQRQVRMRWKNDSGGWRPHLAAEGTLDSDEWLDALDKVLRGETGQPAFGISSDLNMPCSDFRAVATEAQTTATKEDRNFADFIAGFGSEVVESLVNGKRTGIIADTAFRTMSGAGHQHFLGFMSHLEKQTGKSHLRAALLESWTYSDPGPSLRWDPVDDRRYAQRWDEPSGDPLKTVRGANRLAIEALPLFPTVVVGSQLETTGFSQRRRQGAVLSWPIWGSEIGLDVVRSLLAYPELQRPEPDRNTLQRIGVEEVFRCERITQGKYRNFSIAVPV
jgi:hypothetical protein